VKSAERTRWREQQESLIREGSDPAMEDKGLSPDEPFSNFVVISDYFTASVWPAPKYNFLFYLQDTICRLQYIGLPHFKAQGKEKLNKAS
jgi:hypothetical protein